MIRTLMSERTADRTKGCRGVTQRESPARIAWRGHDNKSYIRVENRFIDIERGSEPFAIGGDGGRKIGFLNRCATGIDGFDYLWIHIYSNHVKSPAGNGGSHARPQFAKTNH